MIVAKNAFSFRFNLNFTGPHVLLNFISGWARDDFTSNLAHRMLITYL